MRWNPDVFFQTESRQNAGAPHVQLGCLGQRQRVLVTGSELCYVADLCIQDRLADDFGDVLEAETELATLIGSPTVHLPKLIDGQGVSVAAADFLYQLVLQRHKKAGVQDLQALHGAHLLISDEVLEAKLAELVGAPRVELAEDLAFLGATDLLADVGRVWVEESSAAGPASLRVTAVGVLAHLVAGEGG